MEKSQELQYTAAWKHMSLISEPRDPLVDAAGFSRKNAHPSHSGNPY